ncbi:FtsB family cell division protein [Pseudactinotalea sp. Z1732]|uniref:FtsB family cell division protein n=1 Tax=Pseudactinotalea sp. Z1732 TaxID=3413026 RepID=UPI003C7C1151
MRTLVLFLVVLMAFIVVTPTLRAYVTQAEQQRTLVAQIEAAEERNVQLQRTLDRWDDPAYVQAQARERLGFVYPGETAYLVVDPEIVTGEEVESDPDGDGPVMMPQVGPWYITVTDSLRVAGEAGEE